MLVRYLCGLYAVYLGLCLSFTCVGYMLFILGYVGKALVLVVHCLSWVLLVRHLGRMYAVHLGLCWLGTDRCFFTTVYICMYMVVYYYNTSLKELKSM